jgi:hypothetical protein
MDWMKGKHWMDRIEQKLDGHNTWVGYCLVASQCALMPLKLAKAGALTDI